MDLLADFIANLHLEMDILEVTEFKLVSCLDYFYNLLRHQLWTFVCPTFIFYFFDYDFKESLKSCIARLVQSQMDSSASS